MGKSLDKQLAEFLRKQRGDQSYPQFSRRLGIAISTLHSLEAGHQSITLGKLEDILKRLKKAPTDVFKEQ